MDDRLSWYAQFGSLSLGVALIPQTVEELRPLRQSLVGAEAVIA